MKTGTGEGGGLDEVERKAELGHLRRLSLICAARVKERWLELRQLQLKAVLSLPPLSLSLHLSTGFLWALPSVTLHFSLSISNHTAGCNRLLCWCRILLMASLVGT